MLEWLKKHPLLALLLLLAVAARIALEGVYVDFNEDKARQLFIAQNFGEGYGFSFCTADLTDLSRDAVERIRYWAVGYPLIVWALDLVVGDLVTSSILIDAVGVALLVLALHSILRHCGIGGKGYALFMVFTALTFTPYYAAGSTDMISAGLYVLALAGALRCSERERNGFGRYAWVGLLLFFACFLRYAYYPFVVVIPAFLFLTGIRERNRNRLGGAVVVGLASVVPLLGLFWFYSHYFGSALYLKGTATLYPEHLLHTAPFPLDSLVYTQLIEDNVRAYLPVLAPLLQPGAWLCSAIVLAVLLRHWLTLRGEAVDAIQRRSLSGFYQLLFATMVLNFAIFATYSLRLPPPHDWPFFWTYVMERRYYVPTMLLVQVGMVVALCRNVTGDRLVRWGARGALAVALTFAASYGIYRAIKVHALGIPTIFEHNLRRSGEVIDLIDELHARGGERIVYADLLSVHDACLVALGSQARIVLDHRKLLSEPLRASEATVLLVHLPDEHSAPQRALIEAWSPEVVLDRHGSTIYRIDLPANDPEKR